MNTTEKRLGRSILAVLLGFLAVAVLSTVTDAIMHASSVFPRHGVMSDALFVLALTYRIAFTVFGGFLTAKLAPNHPRKHAIILGAIGTFFAMVGAAATWNRGAEFGPHWYPIALVITALPSILAGEILARRSHRAAIGRATRS
ncbi:MAG TPA: hypothetical protein VIV60_15820 [Polyangiaceae bacterium]